VRLVAAVAGPASASRLVSLSSSTSTTSPWWSAARPTIRASRTHRDAEGRRPLLVAGAVGDPPHGAPFVFSDNAVPDVFAAANLRFWR